MAFHGALMDLTATLTSVTFPLTKIPYDNTVYDTDSIISANGEFTIPSGFSWAQFVGSWELTNQAAAGSLLSQLLKNGAVEYSGTNFVRQSSTGYVNNVAPFFSPWVPVTAGDVYTVQAQRTGLTGTTILDTPSSFFAIELRP